MLNLNVNQTLKVAKDDDIKTQLKCPQNIKNNFLHPWKKIIESLSSLLVFPEQNKSLGVRNGICF